ncbi:MAG TPA: diguanylate cyclase, partial [Azoarcus taiwanensis]|nr:diguanylate cyclase [Azoarcus taiwanensis]
MLNHPARPPPAPARVGHTPTTFRRRLIAIWLCVACLLGAYWTLLYSSHQDQMHRAEEQTQLRAAEIAHALALQAQTQFIKLDYLAGHLAEHWLKEGPEGARHAAAVAREAMPEGALTQVAIANSLGDIVFSDLTDAPPADEQTGRPVSIADREHFRVHLENPTQGLFISAPIFGRVSGQWTVQFTRPLTVEGRLHGVIVVSVSTYHLANVLRDLFPDPVNVAVLMNKNGIYLARSDRMSEVMGQVAPHHSRRLVGDTAERGSFRAITDIDQVDRFYAWHRVTGYPVLVSVGLGRDTALAGVSDALKYSYWQNLAGSTLLLLAFAVISVFWRRHAEQTRRIAETGQRLEKLVAQVPGAVYQYRMRPDGSTCFPYASPGIQDIYGLEPLAVNTTAEPAFARIHPADLPQVSRSIHESAEQLALWRCEYRVMQPDGSIRWVSGRARPERTDEGDTLWHGYIHDVTAEHETAEVLRRSETLLRETLQAVRDGLWSWHVDTGEVSWDARINEMLGAPAEARSLRYEDYIAEIHPADRDRVVSELSSALNRHPNEVIASEHRLRTASGRWLWVEVRGRVVDWDATAQPLRLIGTCTDISARVAETQMHTILLEESMAAIAVLSADRHILEANRRAMEIFVPPGTDLATLTLRSLHLSDEHYARLEPFNETLRRTGKVRLEYPMRDARGEVRWFDMQAVTRDPDDEDSVSVWTLVDITEKHQIQTALAAERLRLTALLRRFPGGVLMEDAAGVITTANPSLCALLGLPDHADKLIGQHHDALCERLGPERAAWLHQPGLTRGEKRRTIEVTHSDGKTLEIDWLPIERGGEQLGRVWLLHDISEQKERERALASLALTDALTNLPNRRSFMASLEAALEDYRQHPERGGALLMLDMDHFKKVNDTYGHATGDLVLQHLARIVRLGLRQHDTAGRIGGEEFAVLLRDISETDAASLANRLRQTLADSPVVTGDASIRVTMSIGLAMLDRQDANRILARADEA